MARESDEINAIAAAVLAADGLTQDEMAGQLGIEQGTVSKRLQRARRLGYLEDPTPAPKPAPLLRRDKIPPPLLDAAEHEVRWSRLREQLLATLQSGKEGKGRRLEITVVRSPRARTAGAAWRASLEAVAGAAAKRLHGLLGGDLLVGVTWGEGLRLLVDRLRELAPLPAGRPRFFPTVGSFPFLVDYPADFTSSAVARDLSRLFDLRGGGREIYLDAVPAFLSADLAAERDALLRFYSAYPAFREVFGTAGRPGLLGRADGVLTGVGSMPSLRDSGSPTLRARLQVEGLDPRELARVAVGDIGGVLLPVRGLSKADMRRLVEINSRFIGPSLQHLVECARRANQGSAPGVVVIASGAAKAEVVLAGVQLGLANELIVDHELANELLRLAEKQRGRAAR